MKSARVIVLNMLSGAALLLPVMASAATCANGIYAAGCAGPNGAVAVRKPYAPPSYYHAPAPYHPPGTVNCASGPYRAGCAGPNGAAVVHKTY